MDFLTLLPDFSTMTSQVFIGLSRAMILFMVAVGLTVSIGVLRVINFANGTFYMLGAFTAWSIAMWVGGTAGFWVALLVAPLVVSVLGLVVEAGLLRRLYNRPRLLQLLLTYAVVLLFNDITKIIWGVDFKTIEVPLKGFVTLFSNVSLPSYNLILLASGPLVAFGLWFFTNHTMVGKITRATATDREMVDALGINSKKIFAIVFMLSCYLAGLGGALIAPTTNIVVGMGITILVNAVLVVVVGGLGNIWGTFLASIIFGVGESFGLLIAPRFAIVFPFAIATVLLILRPTGIMKSVW
ncbi:MAG: branched-chain amino acid ABC transporter permease [Bacillota bacterium]